VFVRAYDDGIAFRYAAPGAGPVEIAGETTTFPLASKDVKYWGQAHPNNYGYETPLGPVTADRISMPVLAELSTQALRAGGAGGELRQLRHPQLRAPATRYPQPSRWISGAGQDDAAVPVAWRW
jgi:hypothetical protein